MSQFLKPQVMVVKIEEWNRNLKGAFEDRCDGV